MNETAIQSLTRKDSDRVRGYKELLDFYHGKHWEGRERLGEKRLTFNYAKVFIDKVTSYLMSGINFTVEATDDSAEARNRAQRAEGNSQLRAYRRPCHRGCLQLAGSATR